MYISVYGSRNVNIWFLYYLINKNYFDLVHVWPEEFMKSYSLSSQHISTV